MTITVKRNGGMLHISNLLDYMVIIHKQKQRAGDSEIEQRELKIYTTHTNVHTTHTHTQYPWCNRCKYVGEFVNVKKFQ